MPNASSGSPFVATHEHKKRKMRPFHRGFNILLGSTFVASSAEALNSTERATFLDYLSRCKGDKSCLVMVPEPTYIERRSGDANGAPFQQFQCSQYIENHFGGVIFEMLKETHPHWHESTLECIVCEKCTFNEMAAYMGDYDEKDNPNGVGDTLNLIYAGYLLYAEKRARLNLQHSYSFITDRVVILGKPGASGGQIEPGAILRNFIDPLVYVIVATILSLLMAIVCAFGGSDTGYEALPTDGAQGDSAPQNSCQHDFPQTIDQVPKHTWDRYVDIHFPVEWKGHPRRLPRRRQAFRALMFLLGLGTVGSLLIFETLFFANAPSAPQTPEKLEYHVKEGQVYVVNNTALQDNMYLTFPDLIDHMELCPSFAECTRLIASSPNEIYLLSLDALAHSKRVLDSANGTVKVFETTVTFNDYAGIFYYSSGLAKANAFEMNDALHNATLKPGLIKNLIKGTTISSGSETDFVFSWTMFLCGFGLPTLVALLCDMLLLIFCFFRSILLFLWSQRVTRRSSAVIDTSMGHGGSESDPKRERRYDENNEFGWTTELSVELSSEVNYGPVDEVRSGFDSVEPASQVSSICDRNSEGEGRSFTHPPRILSFRDCPQPHLGDGEMLSRSFH